MEFLQAAVLACCLITSTPTVPDIVAETLQLNNLYAAFPEELKPYLTEEQETFLEDTYVLLDEVEEELLDIKQECQEKKAEEEARIVAEEEARRLAEEKAARIAAQEAYYQQISDNIMRGLNSVGSPGVNWCAKYISLVYQMAGYGYINGNADDMYYAYCHSSNRDELRNGMLVAVPSWNGNSLSYEYGHIGIYMNGVVWHNIGPIVQTPLDEWIATYGQIAEVRWGFAF